MQVLVSVAVVSAMASSPYSKPAPYYKPAGYDAKYEPEIPACSKNTTTAWCLQDSEYPAYDVVYALDQHYDAVLSLYKDVAVTTVNSVDTLKAMAEETYLCPSLTAYVQPLRAINVEGKWRVIVNKVESYNDKFDQHARVEECDASAVNEPCPLVPTCYQSKCVQKNIYHRFLVFDPYDFYFPFAIENFKLPASCACFVGAFSL